MQKSGKFQGVIIKFTGNLGESTSKKLISSTGGDTIFFLEKPNSRANAPESHQIRRSSYDITAS